MEALISVAYTIMAATHSIDPHDSKELLVAAVYLAVAAIYLAAPYLRRH